MTAENRWLFDFNDILQVHFVLQQVQGVSQRLARQAAQGQLQTNAPIVASSSIPRPSKAQYERWLLLCVGLTPKPLRFVWSLQVRLTRTPRTFL